jgi:DNA-directed RNA polymerase subunit RPC12/RpoP
MGVYTYRCSDCGGEVEVGFGDRYNGRLIWSANHHCQQCGMRMEEDGWGKLPGYLYAIEIEQCGTWAAKLSNPKDRVFVLKAMREVLDLSMSEVRSIINDKLEIFSIGTQAEANFVKAVLDKSYGVKAEVMRADLS